MAPKKKVAAQPKAVNDSRSSGNGGMVTRSTRSASTRQRVDESDELPKSKKPKSSTASTKAKVKGKEPGTIATTAAAADVVAAAGEKSKTVVIEHCKQCNSFKTRAVQVKNGLESGLPGITVLVNPEKPRRGCFEIREEGGEKFISLLDMKRPFTPMKALDMEEVIADIIEKIK